MSRGRPGTRQQRDPQYFFLPGQFGSCRPFARMDLSGMEMPTATRDDRTPSKAFPDLSRHEIAYLRGEHRKGYAGVPIIELVNPETAPSLFGYQPVKWVTPEELAEMYPSKPGDPSLDDILDRVLP